MNQMGSGETDQFLKMGYSLLQHGKDENFINWIKKPLG